MRNLDNENEKISSENLSHLKTIEMDQSKIRTLQINLQEIEEVLR